MALHIGGLTMFCLQWLQSVKQQTMGGRTIFLKQQLLSPTYITATLFVSNYIGICFARTLHYQFYAWYFHTLPFLLWYTDCYPIIIRLVILFSIEMAFLTYPATAVSSLVLQLAHWAILLQIRPPGQLFQDSTDNEETKTSSSRMVKSTTTTTATRLRRRKED